MNTITPAPNRLSEPVIAEVAWRYKDAAKEQARRGIISWKVYREYCAEVDRIKRARLRAAEDAARKPQLDITKSSGEIFSGSTTRDWKYQTADFRVCKVPGCGLWARRTVVKGQVYSACPRHDRRDAETLTAAQIAAGMSRRHENHREPRRADTAYRRGQRAQAQRLVAAGWDADTYREWLNGQQFPSTAAA